MSRSFHRPETATPSGSWNRARTWSAGSDSVRAARTSPSTCAIGSVRLRPWYPKRIRSPSVPSTTPGMATTSPLFVRASRMSSDPRDLSRRANDSGDSLRSSWAKCTPTTRASGMASLSCQGVVIFIASSAIPSNVPASTSSPVRLTRTPSGGTAGAFGSTARSDWVWTSALAWALAFWLSSYITLIVKSFWKQSPGGGSRNRSADDSVPERRTTIGQSSESVVSSRQLVGPLSVWPFTVTCLIGDGRRL